MDCDTDVLIVGAGPVGTWLAAELVAAGVGVRLLEARAGRSTWSRGFTVQPRTLELIDTRGLAEPLLSAGRVSDSWHFAMGQTRLDFAGLPTRFPFVLLNPQVATEELMERRLLGLGGEVTRRCRVTGLRQHPDRVEIQTESPAGPGRLTARYVVGCDGAHSTVRTAAGIPFTGTETITTTLSGDVVLDDPPPIGAPILSCEAGILLTIPLPEGRHLVAVLDHATMHGTPPTPVPFAHLRAAVERVAGTDLGMRDPRRIATVGDAGKVADVYRAGRVLLAGDAAHMHYPMGGQGLNLGVQDAHNLAWRLACVLRAGAAERVLDDYTAERHPVGSTVLADVRAQIALVTATGLDGFTLRRRFDTLLTEYPALNHDLTVRLAQLDVRYGALAGSHGIGPLIGTRAPDLAFAPTPGGNGPRRLFETARPGRFTLLDLTGGRLHADRAVAAAGLQELVTPVSVSPDPAPDANPPMDPALAGSWSTAPAALIRPDGHTAWVGDDPGHAVDTVKSLLF
ncbi:FAD-dependent monooxygenase [Streptomyces sp. NBC_00859]|uniref:FAD-dependent monooxygenase n=1 Tax=Streptomyces sp. NBC_00859 TaxID=2903682 RepID=UPI00386B01F5|nr:FAD-dependent monooxygenase [Streptomyces sp. NBC_00859]